MNRAKPAKYPTRLYNIGIRITGKEKNRILKAAKKEGISLSSYIKYCIYTEMKRKEGIPELPKSQYALPTLQEQVRAYLTGDRLAQPCGEVECALTAEGGLEKSVVEVGELRFCASCNIRVG
ncbi:uncharacterized protein METZ01_LOCUS221237 [marine metagenome]|uniref:Uncharacterized protein n=1 Tax=marine metagenome TaxID=408172 RepID=A0A382G1F6_9ZZZZ